MPSNDTRLSPPSSANRPRVLRGLCALTVFAIGFASAASAAPEHHLVFFKPSPSENVVGYMMHLGTASGTYTQHVDMGQPEPTSDDMLVYSTNIDTSLDLFVAISSYDETGLDSVYSNELQIAAATVDPEPTPEPEPGTDPDPEIIIEPEPEPAPFTPPPVDPGQGTTLSSRFTETILGITADGTGLIQLVRGDGATVALTIDSLAAARDLRPARCDLDADGDSDLLLGFGNGSGGQVALIYLEANEVAALETIVAGDAGYHAADGQTHPACGDVDGDGLNEIVVGFGPAANAQLAVYDDRASGFAPFDGGRSAMIDAPTQASMNSTGTGCVPALGDIDGDGRDELVVGYTASGHRSIAVLDDGLRRFRRHESFRNGKGLMSITSQSDVETDGRGTYPAVGDWDGDGRAEIAVGFGEGAENWLYFTDDALNVNYERITGFLSVQVGRAGSREQSGAVRPSFGDIDGDGSDELIVGFGSQGWHEIQVFEDLYTGSTNLFRGGEGFIASPDLGARWIAAPARN